MIKLYLIVKSWYALSDPALEKQLARVLLFRRFIGLSISESVPDHSTLWRFRKLLENIPNGQLKRSRYIYIPYRSDIKNPTYACKAFFKNAPRNNSGIKKATHFHVRLSFIWLPWTGLNFNDFYSPWA
jgi:hypothetical protein